MKTYSYLKIIIIFLSSLNTWGQCYTSFEYDNSLIEISPAGGSATKVVFYYNCSGSQLTFAGVPSWLTMSSSSDGKIITATVSGISLSARYAEITCSIPSNNLSFKVMVFQGGVYPSPCSMRFTAAPPNQPYYPPKVFNSLGNQISGENPVIPTYTPSSCSSILNALYVPSWLQVDINYGFSLSYSFYATPNNSLEKRYATIIMRLPNGGSEVPVCIMQEGNGCAWYSDVDEDGWGDPAQGILSSSCSSPPFQGVVLDNNDSCPNVYGLDFGGCSTNSNLNWTSTETYAINGNIVGQTKNYFDDLGKSTVSLSKDFSSNIIWGSESTYDTFGRINKTSFIAPSPSNSFDKVKFFGNGTSDQLALKLSNYYSNNNTVEPYQATATHPYAEVEYDKLNPGNVIKSIGGNQIETSPSVFEWKTGFSYTVPAAQEMYYVFGYNFFEGPLSGTPVKEEIQTKFYKTVSIDANGVENVVFTDGEGKTLASARSGSSTSINAYPVYSLIGTQGFVDVCIPPGITSSQITLIGGATNYKVYNLRENTGVPTTAALTGGNCYRIEAIVAPTADPKIFVTNATPGVLSYSTTDTAGAKGVSYSVNYYDYAINIYAKTGRLSKTIQPNGFRDVYSGSPATFSIIAAPSYMPTTYTKFSTSYKYSTLGQVVEGTSADSGTCKFAYRKDGQIRYSQSALQVPANQVSYTNYDSYGRPIESGVITGSSTIWTSALAGVDTPATVTGTKTERTFTVYDYTTNTSGYSITIPAAQSLATLAPTYIQKNLSGNVAVTYKADSTTINAITWYSYDIYGRSEWAVQYNDSFGNVVKTLDYEYDYKGNVTKVWYQKNNATERFIHRYGYDINNTVITVDTSKDNITFINHANYTYYKTGELKRVSLTQAQQGLDYVYTLGGMLKSINHPSLEQAKDPGADNNDLFGITLDYYKGDYLRNGTNITNTANVSGVNQDFTGNIKAVVWANKRLDVPYPSSPVSGTNLATRKAYLYTYDRNNWLTNAPYGILAIGSNSISTNPLYREGSLTYDPNGNIKTLTRNDQFTNSIDNLTYNYYAGKNQLNNVDDTVPVTTSTVDIDDQATGNYTYNALGQMKKNISEGLEYFYNTQGLVTEVKKGIYSLVKFYYNERGYRIKKESFNINGALSSTTYYVFDLSGNVMSNYYKLATSTTISQTELPIYGISRLGVYVKSTPSDYANYEITDHLGNVRVVLNRVFGGSVTLSSYADYYPFGEQLPGRNSNGGYRYAFQGQELDPETGMEAFQLRLWDGRIGRWLSPDPYGQHFSPYLGMGNNPINSIDPDGGWETRGRAWLEWIIGGFKGKVVANPADDNTDSSRNFGIKYKDGYVKNGSGWDAKNKQYNLAEVGVPGIRYHDKPSGSNFWNSTFTRSLIADQYHLSFGFGGGGIVGVGGSFTAHWLTRGPDASIIPYVNFLPDIDVNIGAGAAATADLSFGSSSFQGDVKNITATTLIGPSRYISGTAAEIIGGTVEVSESFDEKNKVSWKNVSYGIVGGAGYRVQTGVKYTMALIHPSGLYGIKRDGGWATGHHLGTFSNN